MSRTEIKQTIDDFISLIEKGCGSPEKNEANLKLLLDKLAIAQHSASYKFDDKEYAEAPQKASEEMRKLVAAQFPKYGYYNTAEDVSQNLGRSSVITGDAIDDIADIARDLFETKWRWEKNSIDDALWYFTTMFETHWSLHLRELQLYLLNLERGT
jgi:hypothetical protein